MLFISKKQIQAAYVGSMAAGIVTGQHSIRGQVVLRAMGIDDIPVMNIENACATGCATFYMAWMDVLAGFHDCVLALGFEQMAPGAIGTVFEDRPSPLDAFLQIANDKFEGAEKVPMALRLFGGAGFEYQEKYGASTETFARVRVKAAQHAEHNERAIFRTPLTLGDVLDGNNLFLNLTRLQCCPPTCGAAAAVICSEFFARQRGLDSKVRIIGQAMRTDDAGSFSGSLIEAIGAGMAAATAASVYEQAGLGPEDLDVVELHDCFTTNEVISYEALGLCPAGGAEQVVADGDSTYGGAGVTDCGLSGAACGLLVITPPRMHNAPRPTATNDTLRRNITFYLPVGVQGDTGDGPIPATRYRMDGDLEMELWYDDSDTLVRLAFVARGSEVTYRLTERSGFTSLSTALADAEAGN